MEPTTMQDHPDITLARLRAFIAQGRLNALLYPRREPVELSVFSTPDRIGYREATRGRYRPALVGEQFGPLWSTHWFRVRAVIPPAWHGKEVHLRWDSSSEACVWRAGSPVQGLTGTSVISPSYDPGRPARAEYVVTRRARGGEKVNLCVEVACNQMIRSTGAGEVTGRLRLAEIAVFDRPAWDLLWDFTVVAEMAEHLPPGSPRRAQALYAANEMLNILEVDEPATWERARAVAAAYLAVRNGGGQHNISATGNAHLDTAWFWPLAETRRKCYRTFSSALRYMDDYPEYRFACPQAQQYEWVKEGQPALYARLRRRVRDGKFIPVGGTWIEPDCNLPSGESLVRQFLFGQRFFQREFGLACREFWNPDVFGYNGQLPQIMRGAGIRWFLTQKLAWNQFNPPARQTFWWEGIDGSRVLAHFPPAGTYGGNCSVAQLLHGVGNYRDLDRSNESIYLFGFGDGGGGPTPGMLERLRRARDTDGLPRVRLRAPAEAFARLEADAKPLTTRVGEMYFENHRGTYTTQAANKAGNRRAEDLLHDAELLAAVGPGTYPREELARLWKLVLLNQFHDVITGCSLNEVHRESRAHYRDILSSGARLRDRALDALGLPPGHGPRLLVVNTLGAPRAEVVDLPGPEPRPAIVSAPAAGWAVREPQFTTEHPVSVSEENGVFVLENRCLRAAFDPDGTLVSLRHRETGRETTAGGANRFALYGDVPISYLAWNVEVYHLEKRRETPGAARARVLERGPLRAAVEFEHELTARSRLRQVVSLDALSPRLDFACEVDWHECERFLKVEFPTVIRSDHFTCEIQFGHVRRPNHFNTSHDLARFEVCAHRWADLSEPGFGLALLNDCKYGCSVLGGTIALSLLRAPKDPDPEADMGRHAFRYALMPHAGSLQDAGVVHEARRFNAPLLLRPTDAPAGERSWFSVEPAGVVLDTVKRAEDTEDLVVRLYEAHGSHAGVRLACGLPVRSAARCNLLEEDEAEIPLRNGCVHLDIRPFEIVTLRFRR